MKNLVLAICLLLIGCQAKVQKRVESQPASAQEATGTPEPCDEAHHCAPTSTEPLIMSASLTDKQKIDLLRTEAHKRGLHWHILCEDYETPDKQFFAYAADAKEPSGAKYIEDGAVKPWWAENGSTQADAAYRLYLKIIGTEGRPGDKLCDFPLTGSKTGQTCDRPMCKRHSFHVPGKDEDYCLIHGRMKGMVDEQAVQP
jgi:hypothetical protein